MEACFRIAIKNLGHLAPGRGWNMNLWALFQFFMLCEDLDEGDSGAGFS